MWIFVNLWYFIHHGNTIWVSRCADKEFFIAFPIWWRQFRFLPSQKLARGSVPSSRRTEGTGWWSGRQWTLLSLCCACRWTPGAQTPFPKPCLRLSLRLPWRTRWGRSRAGCSMICTAPGTSRWGSTGVPRQKLKTRGDSDIERPQWFRGYHDKKSI